MLNFELWTELLQFEFWGLKFEPVHMESEVLQHCQLGWTIKERWWGEGGVDVFETIIILLLFISLGNSHAKTSVLIGTYDNNKNKNNSSSINIILISSSSRCRSSIIISSGSRSSTSRGSIVLTPLSPLWVMYMSWLFASDRSSVQWGTIWWQQTAGRWRPGVSQRQRSGRCALHTSR